MPVDPVCGMTIGALEALAVHEEDGRKVYFCSLACYQAFLRQRGAEDANAETTPPGHPHPPMDGEPPHACCGW